MPRRVRDPAVADPRTGGAGPAHTGAMPGGAARTTAEPSPWSAVPAWGLAALCAGAAVLGLTWAQGSEDAPWRALVIPVIWAVPGALIATARPRAPLGWLNLAVAVVFSATGLATVWLAAAGTPAPAGAAWALWLVDRSGAVIVPLTTAALVLLPDSRFPSPRWRLPVAAAVTGQVVLVALWSFARTPAGVAESGWDRDLLALANPVGVLPVGAASFADSAVWLLQLPLLLAVGAMVSRLRRRREGEREPLVALLLALVTFVVVVLAGRALWEPVADVVDVLASLLLASVLVAAVLRSHLDGVVVVVRHAFVHVALGAVVALAYVVVVGLIVSAGPQVSRFGAGVVAALAALAVLPLRSRLQDSVDRLMHGDRRDPFAAVSRLADSAHRAPSLEAVLARVASSVAASSRVPEVRVTAFGAAAQHPPGAVADGADPRAVRVPLLAGDREVGSLVVVPQPGRRLRADEVRLLEELGRHAGVAADAVHLAAQVAEHHRALVTAREEERRRLGRELHDDLGPTVAGLAMQLGALRPMVRTDPEAVVARLARLEEAATGALADLRRVAHELRPPVLDQVGLGRAVAQVADSLDLAVVDQVVEHGTLPAAVELAAYRIAAEALTNVSRHAGTRTVRTGLREAGGSLVVTVADDGCGTDVRTPGLGTSTMRERAEELGGTLTVRPGEHGGTVVTAVLPVDTAHTAVPERP